MICFATVAIASLRRRLAESSMVKADGNEMSSMAKGDQHTLSSFHDSTYHQLNHLFLSLFCPSIHWQRNRLKVTCRSAFPIESKHVFTSTVEHSANHLHLFGLSFLENSVSIHTKRFPMLRLISIVSFSFPVADPVTSATR